MGDDLPDLGALRLAGWPPAPMTRLRLFVSVPTGSHRYRAGGRRSALADFILQSQGRLSDVTRTF